jgi:hypothetical protein
MESVMKIDSHIGKRTYTQARCQPFTIAADVIAGSCDEIVWFPLPLMLMVLGEIETSAGWEFFGDVCFLAFSEQMLKFIFRRSRPSYAPQGTFYCLPGKCLSCCSLVYPNPIQLLTFF